MLLPAIHWWSSQFNENPSKVQPIESSRDPLNRKPVGTATRNGPYIHIQLRWCQAERIIKPTLLFYLVFQSGVKNCGQTYICIYIWGSIIYSRITKQPYCYERKFLFPQIYAYNYLCLLNCMIWWMARRFDCDHVRGLHSICVIPKTWRQSSNNLYHLKNNLSAILGIQLYGNNN